MYKLSLDYFKQMNDPDKILEALKAMEFINKFKQVAIPYLMKIRNHDTTDLVLKNYCNKKIEDLLYE